MNKSDRRIIYSGSFLTAIKKTGLFFDGTGLSVYYCQVV